MTRDAALLAVALAPGVEPLTRCVVLALLAESGEVPGGFVLGAPVASVASRSGVALRSLWRHIGSLEAAGVVVREGRRVLVVAPALAEWAAVDRATVAQTVPERREPCHSGTMPTVPQWREPCHSGTDRARVALGTDGATHARDSLLGSFQEPDHARARAELLDGLVREPAREAPPSPPEPMGASLTPELRAAMGTLDRACGWAFTPAVWVDGIMAAVRAHGPEATTSAIMALAEWATATPGHRRIPRVTWLPERAAQAAQPKAQGRPVANPNLREMSTCPKFWAEQAAALSARLPAYTMPTPEELEQMPW